MFRTCLGGCFAAALCVIPATAQTNDVVPDLSGVWRIGLHPGYVLNIAADLPPQAVLPWAARLFTQRAADFGATDPAKATCLPFGPRHIIGGGAVARVRIVQTADAVLFLYEDLAYRHIPLGGPDSAPSNASFMGQSSGAWQGDTLVVRTSGFTDRTWLDYTGHPHTEALAITERYRRSGADRIQRDLVISDPKTFTRAIEIQSELTRVSGVLPMLEYVCGESPRNRPLRAAARPSVTLPRAVLQQYVGDYTARAGAAYTVSIALVGTGLVADVDGKGRIPLTALSRTTFAGSVLGTYEFRSVGGETRLFVHSIEGVSEAVRVRPGDTPTAGHVDPGARVR